MVTFVKCYRPVSTKMIKATIVTALVLTPNIAFAQYYPNVSQEYTCFTTREHQIWVPPTRYSPGYVKTWYESEPGICTRAVPVVAPIYPYYPPYYRTPACGSSNITVLGIPIIGSNTTCN